MKATVERGTLGGTDVKQPERQQETGTKRTNKSLNGIKRLQSLVCAKIDSELPSLILMLAVRSRLKNQGEVCRVVRADNKVQLEGIFGGINYETGSLLVFYPAEVKAGHDGCERKKPCGEGRKVFSKGEYTRITFKDVAIDSLLPRRTEGDGVEKERPLERFLPEGSIEIENRLNDEDRNLIESWDQFAENEKRFNVKASFDEEKYTTKLDVKRLSPQQKEQAERISKEIERLPSTNLHVQEDRMCHPKSGEVHNDDEEIAYSAVIGTGRYANNEPPKPAEETAQLRTNAGSGTAAAQPEVIARLKAAQARRNPFQGYVVSKTNHRNSLDCLGIDSACVMDPETYREMRKYKQHKITMQTVQHMKSLVLIASKEIVQSPRKRNDGKRQSKELASTITQFDERSITSEDSPSGSVCTSTPAGESPKTQSKSSTELESPSESGPGKERKSFSKPSSGLSLKAPSFVMKRGNPLSSMLKSANPKYKNIQSYYKTQYKNSVVAGRGLIDFWKTGLDISIYQVPYMYEMPGSYYADPYYGQYQPYVGAYYAGGYPPYYAPNVPVPQPEFPYLGFNSSQYSYPQLHQQCHF